MTILPNGLKVFNATPHMIRFWKEEWAAPIEIESDEIVNAVPVEDIVGSLAPNTTLVRTTFKPTPDGHEIIARAHKAGADIIVGSIIAAQAYPGLVVAMIPCKEYERVAPAEKRMRPDKFSIF